MKSSKINPNIAYGHIEISAISTYLFGRKFSLQRNKGKIESLPVLAKWLTSWARQDNHPENHNTDNRSNNTHTWPLCSVYIFTLYSLFIPLFNTPWHLLHYYSQIELYSDSQMLNFSLFVIFIIHPYNSPLKVLHRAVSSSINVS